MRRLLPFLTYTMLISLSTQALDVSVTSEFGLTEALLVSQDTRYDPKLQLQSSGRFGVALRVERIRIGVAAGLHYAGPSAVTGVDLLRGFRGWHAGADMAVLLGTVPLRRGLQGRVGVAVTGTARFSRYLHTDLLFFYPHFGVGLELEIVAPRVPVSTRLILPIEVYLRRDLRFSTSVGVGFQVVFRLNES